MIPKINVMSLKMVQFILPRLYVSDTIYFGISAKESAKLNLEIFQSP